MEKIPTVFQRDPSNMRFVTRDVTPGCEWVFAGEGIPTIKVDGTNVRITVKGGKVILAEKRRNPTREEKAQGAEPGYVEVDPVDPQNKHIMAAIEANPKRDVPDGVYPCEAVGPKIQGGIESDKPGLYAFTYKPEFLPDIQPRTFDSIKAFLEARNIEGIVWHHQDGRMAKIKRRDFGLPWPDFNAPVIRAYQWV